MCRELAWLRALHELHGLNVMPSELLARVRVSENGYMARRRRRIQGWILTPEMNEIALNKTILLPSSLSR